jgi:Ca2+-transporting ATPase
MGKTGTDVAKQSAEIVLLDDSFHTLVGAIQEGRVIYRNIKKIAIANLSGNTAELFTVLISLFAVSVWKIPIAISAVQILAIDLMAELFPIAALGWDPPESELMTDKPRDLNHHIVNLNSVIDLALSGLLMGTLAYANYILYFYRHGFEPHNFVTSQHVHAYAVATTLTYITICLCQFANIMLRRIGHRKWVFSSYSWSNKKLLVAFAISLSGISLIAYNPLISRYMGTAGIGLVDWIYALSAALLYLIIRQLTKRYGHKPSVVTVSPTR